MGGGLNFDCKLRRESTDTEDLFLAHINAMDVLAKALRIAAKIHEDGTFKSIIDRRYESFDNGFGKILEEGKASLEDCEDFILRKGEPVLKSGKQEKCEMLFN